MSRTRPGRVAIPRLRGRAARAEPALRARRGSKRSWLLLGASYWACPDGRNDEAIELGQTVARVSVHFQPVHQHPKGGRRASGFLATTYVAR